jgi:hypothetical protein
LFSDLCGRLWRLKLKSLGRADAHRHATGNFDHHDYADRDVFIRSAAAAANNSAHADREVTPLGRVAQA